MTAGTTTRSATRQGALGTSAPRPDGIPKVQGRFAFSSDAWAEHMLWGATLRSPHPHARIRSIDVSAALALPGVSRIITADDVPGQLTYGLITADQPVFARDVVRYVGEPVAAVAADHPETARRALQLIVVDYEPLPALLTAAAAIDPATPAIHPDGNVIRHQRIVHGDQNVVGDVIVEGTYDIGMQDQAFLGLEAALALPDDDGNGVELYVATQWLHEDQKQIAACLGVPEERVRLTLGGVGGAFGGREDISLQVHCCLLALATGDRFTAAASLSICDSWAKHAWTTPKPRMAPHGGLFVRTAQPSTVALAQRYGPWMWVMPLMSTADDVLA